MRERQRIEAVPNAVDTGRFHPPADKSVAKEKVGAHRDRPLLLMLANLAAHKGQETAIRATAALKHRGIEADCWLAGIERQPQGFADRLRTLAIDAGVQDRVRFLGHRADTPELLRAADFFLLPSTCEGLPVSLLEAQASGLPVLASPTAGVPEAVIDGHTGFMIPAADVEAYASCICALLHDVDLSRRVAHCAVDRVRQRYGWDRFRERMYALYESVHRGQPLPTNGSRANGQRANTPITRFPATAVGPGNVVQHHD
jgi:phosphatidylinositol alpha-1,6-mannosyltransferase